MLVQQLSREGQAALARYDPADRADGNPSKLLGIQFT
jgi:hypothetical protein